MLLHFGTELQSLWVTTCRNSSLCGFTCRRLQRIRHREGCGIRSSRPAVLLVSRGQRSTAPPPPQAQTSVTLDFFTAPPDARPHEQVLSKLGPNSSPHVHSRLIFCVLEHAKKPSPFQSTPFSLHVLLWRPPMKLRASGTHK